jgi:integrase
MASFRKRNGKWQVQVRRVGARPVSRTFSRKPDAEMWAREREHAIEVQGVVSHDGRQKHTVLDVLSRYETAVLPHKRSGAVEGYVVRALMRHPLAGKLLRHLTTQDLAQFRDERLVAVKPSTFRRQFTILRHALRLAAMEWGWTVPSGALTPIRIPSAANNPISRVSSTTLERLLLAADRQQNWAIAFAVRLAVATGMRRSELLNLRWADVDLQAHTLNIRTSKNGHPRQIPLSPSALALLSSRQQEGERVVPISANCLKLGFTRARRSAKVQLRFHDLRNEAISRFFDLGLTVPEVQLISGHRTMSQLSRYAHADLRRVATKLSATGMEASV